MMKRSVIGAAVALALLSLVVLPGCGASEASVAGTYELDKEAIRTAAKAEMEKEAAKEGEDEGMAQFGSALMLGMLESMTMTLTLNADNSASMAMSMMGDTENASGTWKLDGKSIVITMAAEGETPEPANGTVDGDTITLKPKGDDGPPFDLVFKKKKA